MKPFVELSFMPTASPRTRDGLSLSSKCDAAEGLRRVARPDPPPCHTPAGSLWSTRGCALWFFEVWNEPNLKAFGTGQQSDYFKLYQHTVRAIKAVDSELKVGGPATSANAWIPDFLTYCAAHELPVDFVSTHHYPTDGFGKPDDDTVAQLAASKRSALRDQAGLVRKQAGQLPVYYTEWCTSSNPRDPLHDEPYAAAFIVKTITGR